MTLLSTDPVGHDLSIASITRNLAQYYIPDNMITLSQIFASDSNKKVEKYVHDEIWAYFCMAEANALARSNVLRPISFARVKSKGKTATHSWRHIATKLEKYDDSICMIISFQRKWLMTIVSLFAQNSFHDSEIDCNDPVARRNIVEKLQNDMHDSIDDLSQNFRFILCDDGEMHIIRVDFLEELIDFA